MSRVCYLAEPIDQSDYGAWKEAVSTAQSVAMQQGWLVYRPATAWRVHKNASVGPEIEAVNRFVLEGSGALVAVLPKGVPSIGVPREIEYAAESLVPTLVISDYPSWSLHDVDVARLDDTDSMVAWFHTLQAVQQMGGPRPLIFTSDGGKMPTRSHDADAGWDLYVSEERTIGPGEFCDVPCGIRVALPPRVWARISGRSSTLRKRQLMVAEGVIDGGYRGPLFSGVWNLGTEPHTVHVGERIAQLLLHDLISGRYQPIEVDGHRFDRVPSDGRGEAGFGSSGD